MSHGDFGYGSSGRPNRDNPDQRVNPFSSTATRSGYQGTEYSNFNELVDTISSNIFTINSNVSCLSALTGMSKVTELNEKHANNLGPVKASHSCYLGTTLERAMKQIGTTQDCVQLRNKIHSTEQNTNHVINETVYALRRLAKICSSLNRQHKVQHGRLSSEFQDTVKRYNTLQKKVAEKVKSSVILKSQGKKMEKLIDIGDEDNEDKMLNYEQKRAQVLAQEEAIEVEVALLEEREQHIRQLESDILDINEIFRDLGSLVHEQGAVVDTIESNIESTVGNVESATEQLQQAAAYQRKARKKMCILIAVLVVIGGIIALTVALSIKH